MEFFRKSVSRFKERIDSDRIFKLSVVSYAIQGIAGFSLFLNVVLVVAIMQLYSKLTIDSALLSNINNSDKVVLVDAFDVGMPNVDDRVTRVMVEYFIENAFSVNFNYDETFRRVNTGGELYYLTSPEVWTKVFKIMQSKLEVLKSGNHITTATEVKSISKIATNLWRVNVDFRNYDMDLDKLTVQTYVMNMRVGYFPQRVRMGANFKNPLGFAVIEFNHSQVYSN